MKKISIYIPLLMLAACAAEEAPESVSPEYNESARIVVFGGSTAPGATRADEFPEPTNLGVCNADRLKIMAFKGTISELETNNITAAKLKLTGTPEDIKILKNLNYRDKWTTHSMSVTLNGTLDNWFAFPAIAYNSKDENKFAIPLQTNTTTYSGLKLNISATTSDSEINIPELYFGRLTPSKNYKSGNHSSEDMVYKYSYKTLGGTETDELQLEGKLYRIVSQLNVNISEVSTNVEKIEMYLSNIPTQIGLYAPHRSELRKAGTDRGYYYPIVEATGDDQHYMNETLVCTVTNKDFVDGTAKLSTFLLPSAEGRTVTVKAYIRSSEIEATEESEATEATDAIDETGETGETGDEKPDDKIVWKIIERSKLLQASTNHYLTPETSKVYFSADPLPVYNAVTSEFISYPNVRVNVSGKLSDIFSEESESNIEIEICPNYDGEHEIKI